MNAPSGPENLAPGHDPLQDDRALWDLLGRAPRPPVPGPFFERRVLRAVANLQEEQVASSWPQRLANLFGTRRRRAWSGASLVGAVAAVMLAMGGSHLWTGSSLPSHGHLLPVGRAATPDGSSANVPGGSTRENDYKVIANLDELTENNDNHVWLDEDDENSS